MHILILGAGYAGLRAALELERLLPGDRAETHITLLDRNLYHQHIVLLHLAATGGAAPSEVAFPLEQILRQRAIRLCNGQVASIDPTQRQVLLTDGLALTYDWLIVALGAETDDGGVPGARAYSLPLRTHHEALQLRSHILTRFADAARTDDARTRRALLTFAIVGGGFTGCQLAGELVDWARRLCPAYGLPTSAVRIPLIERSPLLLKQAGDWASREAVRVLNGRGISLHLQTAVDRVEEAALAVAPAAAAQATTNGPARGLIRTTTVVWTAGIRAPGLLAAAGLETDARGRLLVDRRLRVVGQERIFAAGDCAAVPDARGGMLPATASYALRQGEYLASAVLATSTGRTPPPYAPQYLGQVVSLGPGDAVGDPLGLPISGAPAALLKQAIDQWYLTTLW